ncbi:MAG: nitroreductase family protein [Candidatus Thorarchaeota archaeon]|jgi:nitroreductase
MSIHIDSWYTAIFQRHSRRSYTGEPLPEETIEKLERTCNDFKPFDGARAVLIRDPPDRVFKGLIGSYGQIKNAPHFIAFIGDTSKLNFQEVVGYLGEGLILEATALDVNTCWVGGMFRREIAEERIEIRSNERVIAMTPIGYALEKKTRGEKIASRSLRADKRKPLESLIESDIDIADDKILKALEAAQLAPSAANRQPWRFRLSNESITIFTNSKMRISVSPRLDCGIAMLHLELGASVNGISGNWIFHEAPRVAEFAFTNVS